MAKPYHITSRVGSAHHCYETGSISGGRSPPYAEVTISRVGTAHLCYETGSISRVGSAHLYYKTGSISGRQCPPHGEVTISTRRMAKHFDASPIEYTQLNLNII